MPVLARVFEEAGLSSAIVTMMPYFAEKIGTPRTLGVEFPFGHAFGPPGDAATQTRVVREALRLLEEAKSPGEARELDIQWPQPLDEAKKDWQPLEPSPVVKMMLEQRRAAREGAGGSAASP